jgi:hypothetical protein
MICEILSLKKLAILTNITAMYVFWKKKMSITLFFKEKRHFHRTLADIVVNDDRDIDPGSNPTYTTCSIGTKLAPTYHPLKNCPLIQGCQIFLCNEKNIPNSQQIGIPNAHKIYQMAVK